MVKVYVGNNVSRRPVMVPEDTTLRKVLEDAQIDYSLGMTTLQGATMSPGDLDKTFRDHGVTEECYLLNVAKAVNAAGIKVLGQTAVVESGFEPAEIREVAKYRPDSLTLKDAETKEVNFAVGMGSGKGVINKNGAEFGSGKSAEGKAIITMDIPDGEDAKDYIEKKIGVAILNLQKVEDGLRRALGEIADEKAKVLGTIEIL